MSSLFNTDDIQDTYLVSNAGVSSCHVCWVLVSTNVLTDKKTDFKCLLRLRNAANDSKVELTLWQPAP